MNEATSMTIKLHILHCGYVRVDKALPFADPKSWNPLAFTGLLRSNKHQVWLPVSAYLIEHPKGLILIDTGWHTDVRRGDQGRKHLGLAHWLINKADLPEGMAIHEQLARLGYQPSDIDYLLMSHLHSDHASGLQLVKDAKRILVADLEWQETRQRPLNYIASMWRGVNIEQYSFVPTGTGHEGLSFDLFGDESITMVYTPGHTLGLAATIVRNNGKFVLLTSDVGYAKRSWEQMILPGVQVDKQKVRESLQWVKTMSQHPDCLAAIANHDPDLTPHVITL